MSEAKLSPVEALKATSHRLRGTLEQELAAGGIQVSEDAYQLLKFHGSYEQFDRDTATDRKQHGLEKEYQFMLRVRMPGGRLTAAQYLALDELADDRANGTIRITTRQGIQFHGILKGDLKPAIADINHTLLTTMSACGDVVRNVMCSPTPTRDAIHARLWADAQALSEHLKPKSRAYYEIFLDEAPEPQGRRGGAALRPHLPAAQIQDRHHPRRRQHDRRAHQRSRAHRHFRRRNPPRLQHRRRRRPRHDAQQRAHLSTPGDARSPS